MPNDLSGQIFGQYKLVELLGTGGMSLVYRAQQLNMEREVAIKIMAPALAKQEGFVHRFKEEAATFAKLEHSYIVPIYDYDQHENYLYLVLRLMNGGSLSDHLSRERLMPLSQIARTVEQVADALGYAHQQGILHRDIKPGNILLDADGHAYLMDFGIAKLIAETKGGGMSTLLGTPAYIAPEQWQNATVDQRADIYSLGMVIYAMLVGDLPFAKSSPFYLMYSHLHENLPPPSQQRDNLPTALDDVMFKALAKEPGARYASVKAFAEEFVAAVAAHTTASSAERDMLNPTGSRPSRPAAKRDSRLDKLWIALERASGHVYVTPDVETLFQAKPEERRTASMDDIWDELERPPTAVYDTRRLQDLLEHIKKDQAFLGVKAQRVGLPEAIKNQVEQDTGLLLIGVEPDSPAEQGDLFLGDLLLALDGQPLRHQDDLIQALGDERIEKTVSVQFVRTGKILETTLTLTKRISGKSTL